MKNEKKLIVSKEELSKFENMLWEIADKLRGNLSAEDYMHVVVGIIAIKYINDKFEIAHKKIQDEYGMDDDSIEKEDYKAYGALFVPEKAKWNIILKSVGTSELGTTIDNAINTIENEYSELKNVFTTKYNEIDQIKLGDVVRKFDEIKLSDDDYDVLGHVYEFFLGKFFLDRGQKGGEFYTPRSIVQLITMFLNIEEGKVYDPACGSGGMLVCAKKYIESIGKNINAISVWGQEYNKTTRNLAILNLVINGILIKNKELNDIDVYALGNEPADTFKNDQHKGRKFDYIMANPPFNLKVWYSDDLQNDERWKYGLPNKGNANFAWLQHILFKLSSNGKAGVVLANGSLTSTTGGDDKIRENIIKDNKISCIVALPDKLFFTTGISACIWFFDNNKSNDEILFIDAQELGTPIQGSKKNKEIVDEDIKKLTTIFHDFEKGKNINTKGLAKSVTLKEIEENNYSLLPGRYIELKEDEKKDINVIKKELEQDIKELMKLMDESKELEKDLLSAISKLNLNEEVK